MVEGEEEEEKVVHLEELETKENRKMEGRRKRKKKNMFGGQEGERMENRKVDSRKIKWNIGGRQIKTRARERDNLYGQKRVKGR